MTTRSHHHGRIKKTLVAAGIAGLTLLALPSDAFADKGRGRGRGDDDDRRVFVAPGFHRDHDHGRRFSVPRVIHKHHVNVYKPYFFGSVYYAPHRHRHTIYRFPVYDPYGYVHYYPYAYCEGALYDRGFFSAYGPRFSFGFRF